MGYKRKVKTFVLEFDDEEFAGLELEVKSLPLGKFLALSKKFDQEDKDDAEVEEMILLFFGAMISWNMEDENDQAMEMTYENLLTLDLDFVMACISAWLDAIASVPSDLGKDSKSGETSLMSSVPTESL